MIDCGTCPFLVEKPATFVRLCHARTLPVAHREARAHARAQPRTAFGRTAEQPLRSSLRTLRHVSSETEETLGWS